MLVNWTTSRVKIIQVPSSKEMVRLAPGYNEVKDSDWLECRNLVLCQIASGVIVEEWQDVEKDGKQHKESVFKDKNTMPGDDPKQPTVVRVPAVFKDLNRPRAKKIIAETFNPKTLEAWADADVREDIIKEINKQLDGVNKGTITG
jgi:hypothetical protein